MKKLLPFFLLLIGALVVGGVYFFVIKGKADGVSVEEETALIEVSLIDRPIASLTPTDDGHWLKLIIEKIVIDAESLDYELLYKLPDGRTQGVPGTIKLTGQEEIERDLLLGSESSGKFRYDEGVTEGTLTLRFRNEKGKLIAKFKTDFNLQTETDRLSSVDDQFQYKLEDESEEFFITMETFGIPSDPPSDVTAGPFGIFSSTVIDGPGIVILAGGKVYRWGGSDWVELDDSASASFGVNSPSSE